MKTVFIVNGSNSLVMIPENESERILLKGLTAQENVVSKLGESSVYGMTYGVDSVIICRESVLAKKENAEQEESM